MAAPTFGTHTFANVAGTPTATLGVALYTLHTTFFHPIKKADQPLPPHVWGLYHTASKKFLSVGTSGANGQCVISQPKKLIPGVYALQVFPLPDATQASYIASKEAWIDLDTGDWLAPALVPGAAAALLKNKILRIPSWTTDLKATKYGGGFKDAPPKSQASFGKTGLLKSKEIEPYGVPATAWEMPLDFNWIRSHVCYHFINWKTAQEEVVPPGLLIEARDAAGKRIGAGSAVDPNDGTAYVLIASTKEKWKSIHVGFGAPVGARVDISAAKPSPDVRLTAAGAVPDDRNTRVTLPKVWHSLGQSAIYAPTPSGAATAPKIWDDLRKDLGNDGAATEPLLTFHLNDVALVSGGKLAKIPKDSRLTLFDHLLTIQNPDAQLPHLTTGTFSSPLIPAKTAFAVAPPNAPKAPTVNRDLGTRLFNLQGTFFDLEEAFVSGTPGKTRLLGARAAVAGAHPIAPYTSGCKYIDNEGRYELHAIPVPFVKDPVTSLDLTHGLLYVGSLVTGKKTVAAGGKPYSANVVSNFYKLLTQAAVRWSQGHPGVVDPAVKQKDYRVVSKNTGKRGRGVIRLRYFFNERSDNHHTFAIKLTVDKSKTQDTRSFVQESQMTYYDADLDHDANPSGSTVKDQDMAPAGLHALAHEFGHVLGLPDEYYEQVDQASVDSSAMLTAPFLPRYAQYDGWKSGARPYWTDNKSMMRTTQLLRLRHVWHHARALSEDAKFASLQDRPFVVRSDNYPSGGLECLTPAGKAAPGKPVVGNLNNPYTPLSLRGKLPHAQVIVFPVGDDEGTVESMFPAPGTPGPVYTTRAAGTRFDAIVVVRSYYRFVFAASILNRDRWNAMQNFQKGYFDPYYVETFRFQLVGGTVLTRMAVVFAPHYAAGAGTPPDWNGADPTHFRLNITGPAAVAPAKNPLLADHPGTTLSLGLADVNLNALLRMVLGGQSWIAAPPGGTRTVDTSPITTLDLVKLAALVDGMIGDPAGSRIPSSL